MRKWFKEHFTKDKIISLILTGVIILLVLLIVFFENEDKKNMENKQSDISLCDTEANLNTSWSINNDGNLVGNNLLQQYDTRVVGINDAFVYNSILLNLDVDKTYTFSCKFSGNGVDYIALFNTSLSERYSSTNENLFTFTANASQLVLVFYVSLDTPLDNTYYSYYYDLMLNEGSTALPWEPYLSMV